MITFDDLGPAAQEALVKMTAPQRVFVREVFEGASQTEAYRRAYPENKSPSSCGTELAKKEEIKLVLEEMRLLAAREFAVDEQKILGAYAHLAFGDVRDFYGPDGGLIPVRDLPRHIANMIQSYEEEEIWTGAGESRQNIGTLKKLRLINRKEALDSLARTQGLFLAKPKEGAKEAKVVRFPSPVSKEDWQKQHSK